MQDHLFQGLALEAARTREGFCAPNPAVGAVVVKDGEILSKGAHQAAGRPHAEVEALAPLGDEARGATLYVTLEPCCHWGRTPPCTDLIVEKGIRRVVYAHGDPNPLVAGRGEKILLEKGVFCERLRDEATELFYGPYDHWTRTGLPYVVGKLAFSLDGRTSGPGGRREAITGEEASRLTHEGRYRADAILTTRKTIDADDPRLDARTVRGEQKKTVYVLDTAAGMSPGAAVFRHAEKVVVLHAENADPSRLVAAGAEAVALPRQGGVLSLDAVLECIGSRGVHQLWVEAGATLFHALRAEGHLSRVLLYVAPRWLGDGRPAFPESGGSFFPGFSPAVWRPLGQDAVCEMRKDA